MRLARLRTWDCDDTVNNKHKDAGLLFCIDILQPGIIGFR